MNEPRFDEVVLVEIDKDDRFVNLVVHRGPDGKPTCWHSPLTGLAVHCAICASGARVYVTPQ
jgi:hypothetical protein